MSNQSTKRVFLTPIDDYYKKQTGKTTKSQPKGISIFDNVIFDLSKCQIEALAEPDYNRICSDVISTNSTSPNRSVATKLSNRLDVFLPLRELSPEVSVSPLKLTDLLEQNWRIRLHSFRQKCVKDTLCLMISPISPAQGVTAQWTTGKYILKFSLNLIFSLRYIYHFRSKYV
jgi:hypothetical protein